MGGIYKAFIVQTLLAVIVLGMAFVLCALVDKSQSAVELLFDVCNYLPFLYLCLSFLGVVLFLPCSQWALLAYSLFWGRLSSSPTSSLMSTMNTILMLFEGSCLRRKYDSVQKQLGDGDGSWTSRGCPHQFFAGLSPHWLWSCCWCWQQQPCWMLFKTLYNSWWASNLSHCPLWVWTLKQNFWF